MNRLQRTVIVLSVACAAGFFTGSGTELEGATDGDSGVQSRIVSVKLYRNQARIVRTARVSLEKGTSTVVLTGLPRILHDWSVRGSLQRGFSGRILSLEVAQKALLKKREKRILTIEKRLERLRERDQELLDELRNIASQENFLNAVLDFTNQNVSKELATRIPQVRVWDNTLSYVSRKKSELLRQKRRTEKKREEVGRNIQKWEFELSQIAGNSYYKTYRALNQVMLTNRSAMNVQQFAEITGTYARRNRLLRSREGKVDIEKQVIASVYSPRKAETTITIQYVIPSTSWRMLYDIRASRKKGTIHMVVYADIYQKTGENWKNIDLALSTGAPVSSIRPPSLSPWFLDIRDGRRLEGASGAMAIKSRKKMAPAREEIDAESPVLLPETRVREKGPYFEIALPMKQTILSSAKYQKKYLKEYNIRKGSGARFYYEVRPSRVRTAYLRVETTNVTELPWLSGESQIFLENEFMGKVSIPDTPPGKKEDLVLGIEPRISAKKELVKKYEDEAGVFGGKRRIKYEWKITVENQIPQARDVLVHDVIPVSRNKKIEVMVENLSRPYMKDPEFEKSTEFARGIRRWKVSVPGNSKIEITYDVTLSFDRDIPIQGIR